MGIAERKEKQKAEIRLMILDAAMKLFVEEGFENVTMRRIADLIEYSPTTVYLYFKDKNEILYNLHELGFQKLGVMNQNLADIANPITRLHKMGENYIDFGLGNHEWPVRMRGTGSAGARTCSGGGGYRDEATARACGRGTGAASGLCLGAGILALEWPPARVG